MNRRRCTLFSCWVALFVTGCSSGDDAEIGVFMEPEPEPTASAPDAGVLFDLPGMEPGQGDCRAGEYVGAFNCEMDGGALAGGTISGPVTFNLVQSLEGEFLELTSGFLNGSFGAIEFSSPIEGELDCSTSEFHAVVVDGQYVNGTLSGTFTGTLDGRLDRTTQWLLGTFTAAQAEGVCVGQWSAVRQR